MSAATWLDDNNQYLAVSLQWLRARLQAWAQPEVLPSAAPAQAPAASAARPGLFERLRGHPAGAVPVALPAPEMPLPDRTSAQAAAAREAAAQTDPPPALLLLARNLGLSEFERDIVLLCVALELDPAMAAMCAAVPGQAGRACPSFALALQVLPGGSWDALSPHRPLRYLRLLEIHQPGATALTAAALRADERIVNFVKGLNEPDERLSALLMPFDPGATEPLSASQRHAAELLESQWRTAAETGAAPKVQLLGADSGSKRAVASHAAAALNRRLFRIAAESLPSQRAELETLARLWQRESLLLPLALYVDAEEIDSAPPEGRSALQWFLARELGPVAVALREPPARMDTDRIAVEVARPLGPEQCEAWTAAIRACDPGGDAPALAAQLAGQFQLNLEEIARLAAAAAPPEPGAPLEARLWRACCDLTRPRLDQLAQRIEPKAGWDDMVVDAEATGLLRQIAAQVRGRYRVYQDWGYASKTSRGLGINALFAGGSGTGKTMAAEVLANELRLALYRIDLSAVVSKYIGETEKNLRRLFDAAEQGGAILFFDEADALFGKRSEVKDSHDRYANIEINYLLQRMEAFSGLAILATNMKSALDPAFMRRLRFIVNFSFPGAAERRRIWQRAFAPGVPRADLDFDHLSRFALSGGNIQSIALHASFAATQRPEGERLVTMPLLMSAVRTELRKLDKPVNEAELQVAPSVVRRIAEPAATGDGRHA